MAVLGVKAGDVVEKIAEDAFGAWGRVPIGGRIVVLSVDEDGCVGYEVDNARWRYCFSDAQTGIEAFDDEWFRVVA